MQWGRPRFDLWVGKIPGEGNGSSLQYSCLENPMDRKAWCATVYGVAKSGMQPSTHACKDYWNYAVWEEGFKKLNSLAFFSHLSTFTTQIIPVLWSRVCLQCSRWHKQRKSWHWNSYLLMTKCKNKHFSGVWAVLVIFMETTHLCLCSWVYQLPPTKTLLPFSSGTLTIH